MESQSGNETLVRKDSNASSVSDDEEYKEESDNNQVSSCQYKQIFNLKVAMP